MKPVSLSRTVLLAAMMAILLLSGCELPNIGQLAALPNPAGGEVTPTPEAVNATTVVSPAESSSPAQAAIQRELSPADFSANGDGAHGLIIFTSQSQQPFTRLTVSETQQLYSERYLWAFATDGSSAGRISPTGFGAALLPPQKREDLPRLLEYGVSLGNDAIEIISAPEECNLPTDSPFDPENPTCGDFQFSPDGRFLAYSHGEASCGRGLTVLDLSSGKPVRTFENVHWATFMDNSAMMLARGDCNTNAPAQAAYYVPHTGQYAGAAFDGVPFWSPNRSAVLFQSRAPSTPQALLWGFNMQTGRVFMWMNDLTVLEDTPTWLPGSEEFLFNHRKARYDKSSHELVLEGPRQVVRMNANNRAQKLLAYDGGYDYHLCLENGQPCDRWYGDWVKVTRTPYQPLIIQVDPATMQIEDTPTVHCALTGQDCATTPEEFALNVQTGELIPWEQAGLFAPTSAQIESKPDLDAAPVYADDAGRFYPGLDGHSLWYLPTVGEAQLWVQDGEGFVYLP